MDYSRWLGARNMLAEMSVYSSECIKTNHEIQYAEGGEKHGVFPQVFLRRGEAMNGFAMEEIFF